MGSFANTMDLFGIATSTKVLFSIETPFCAYAHFKGNDTMLSRNEKCLLDLQERFEIYIFLEPGFKFNIKRNL